MLQIADWVLGSQRLPYIDYSVGVGPEYRFEANASNSRLGLIEDIP